jgi:DNA-binding beta-propeller fold protein YncE
MTATRSNPGLGDLARPWFGILIMACLGLASVELARANATGEGSPGPDADSCGLGSRDSGEASAPSAPFPVALPRASLLGARNDLPNPYSPGVHWGRLPDGRRFGAAIGLAASPDGTIWVFDNCGVSGPPACDQSPVDPILQFDQSGRLLKSFGRGLIAGPHKLTLDREGNVWVTDHGTAPGKGHQVIKFSPDGRVLLKVGTPGVAGPAPDQFDQPTEVAVAPNGDFFVADGQSGRGDAMGNARVVKFDRTGKLLKTWGRKGMGPGEFDIVHSIALDSRGRVFVADRQNNRVQIFDADGRFIAQWFQFGRPSGIYIDRNDVMYVADSESRDGRTKKGITGLPATGYGMNVGARRGIRIGSAKDGSVRAFIPDPCPYPYPGTPTMADGVTADAEGNVYGGDYLGTVRKFVKKR